MKHTYTTLHTSFLLSALMLSTPSSATNEKHDQKTQNPYISSGEVTANSAVIWGRCNNEINSYLKVYIAEQNTSASHTKNLGPLVSQATKETDYTASIQVYGLQPHTNYSYWAVCQNSAFHDFQNLTFSKGEFRTAPSADQETDIRFLWGADLAGQGYGINNDLEITNIDGETIKGGYVIFDAMKKTNPDFAIFQGDNIYADNPIPATVKLPDEMGGGLWTNHITKDFIAITLDQFRENWRYNLQDQHYREFLKTTSSYYQWDDHEVSNNWYPGEILTAEPYNGIAANVLAERAKQALFEYTPTTGRRIFKKFQHGKHAEIFLLDERSFRGANTDNKTPGGSDILGAEQLDWFKRGLKNSTATWKIISTDDPLGIVVNDGDGFDGFANDLEDVAGREVQLAEILKFIKDENIKNVVWLTSDVHFSAAISYDPKRAKFKDFSPFYEFVIGPLHAGVFGPGVLDPSFGAEYEYVRGPLNQGLPEYAPPPFEQAFGIIDVSKEGELTVKLTDITGEILFEKQLEAE